MNIPRKNETNNAFQGIKYVQPGKVFKTHCIVRRMEIRYKQNGEPYLFLELGDRSGRLPARVWDRPFQIAESLAVGKIVLFEGLVQVFQQRRELRPNSIAPIPSNASVILEDLLPVSSRELTSLKGSFREHGTSLKDPFLLRLWEGLTGNTSLLEAFEMAPAGKLWHHNHLHGLLEHTVNMLDVADVLSKQYPLIDTDLLKCGIFCRNLGRAHQYQLEGFVDYSDEGRLLGSKPAALELVESELRRITGFGRERRLQLLHLIVFDEGKAQAGEESLMVLPMTLEAILLNQLLMLDAYADALCRISQKDTLPNSNWTKFITLLNRYIFVGGRSCRNSFPHQGAETLRGRKSNTSIK